MDTIGDMEDHAHMVADVRASPDLRRAEPGGAQSGELEAARKTLQASWHISEGPTILLRSKSWRLSYALKLVISLACVSSGLIYLTNTLFTVLALTGTNVVGIAIVTFLLSIVILTATKADLATIELTENELRLTWRGLFGSHATVMIAERMTYAYGEIRTRIERQHDRMDYPLVIGYRGSDAPIMFTFNDDAERESLAVVIRHFYALPEFPISTCPSEVIYCLQCKYDMQGSVAAEKHNCPECGTPLKHWQVRHWQTAMRNKIPPLTPTSPP